jgi:drug/metabolite transporter (DMT)-like permease
MRYWKLIFINLILLSILATLTYGFTYLWSVIILKDTMSLFLWMWNFIVVLSVIYANYKRDSEE